MADETKVQAEAVAEAPAKIAETVADTAEKIVTETAKVAKRERAKTVRRAKRQAVVAIGHQLLGANDPRPAQAPHQQLGFRQNVGREARRGRFSFPCLDLGLQHAATIEVAEHRDTLAFRNFIR